MRYLIQHLPIAVTSEYVLDLATALNIPVVSASISSGPTEYEIIVETSRELTQAELTTAQAAVRASIAERVGLITQLD